MDIDTLEKRFEKSLILERQEEQKEEPNLISELTEQYKLAYELRERDKADEKNLTLERMKAYTSYYKDNIRKTQIEDICILLKSIKVTHDEYMKIRDSLKESYMENIRNYNKVSEEKVDNFLKEFHDHFGNNIDEFIKEDEMVVI